MASPATLPQLSSARVLTPGGPYEAGETIALSFVDPAIARIHRWSNGQHQAPMRVCVEHAALPEGVNAVPDVAVKQRGALAPIGLRLEWTVARVGRMLSLSEKLLAIDRLGWYRHALAMRLLLPDELIIDDPEVADAVARQLRALKIAATEALGTPLLAALMPNFTLDEEWLRSIETPVLARSAAALRDTLSDYAENEDAAPTIPPAASHISVGILRRDELESASGAGLDAFLAALIPCDGATPELAASLAEYKSALIELFGQTAQASAAVRTNRLATPNPVLDERLACVAGEIDRAFGRLAVA